MTIDHCLPTFCENLNKTRKTSIDVPPFENQVLYECCAHVHK